MNEKVISHDYFEFTPEQNEFLHQITVEADKKLSVYAAKDCEARKAHTSKYSDTYIRTNFGIDIDLILHNQFYNRYADKTQVFSFYKNDDLTRRALHVQLVSRIGQIIGRALNLNLELIEAIALGHDMGHTPFGHKGETFLSDLYFEHCGKMFNHNVHSVRVLKQITNCNLTLQTLDGILCHNGEKGFEKYEPNNMYTFAEFDQKLENCYFDKKVLNGLKPCTLEGCVVRISDMIAYLGKDRQDSYKAGLRVPSFASCKANNPLGTNSQIINNIICNIVKNSIGKPFLSMDSNVFDAFIKEKDDNTKYIYSDEQIEAPYLQVILPMFQKLYPVLLSDLSNGNKDSYIYKHYINTGFLDKFYVDISTPVQCNDAVVDYIASMTDDYFIDLFKKLFPSDPLNNEIQYVSYFEQEI